MLRVMDATALTYDYSTQGGYKKRARRAPYISVLLSHLRTYDSHPWRLLDLGGGIGKVSDYLLGSFPQASAVVLDASRAAIEANLPDARKTCICDSAENAGQHFALESFDLILMHDFLHHVVTGHYGSSGRAVERILRQARSLLHPGGHISIHEEVYDGWIDNLPGRMVFAVTSPHWLAPLSRRLGACTAGVGVRFQSTRGWQRTLECAGLIIDETFVSHTYHPSRLLRLALGLRHNRGVHFWCH